MGAPLPFLVHCEVVVAEVGVGAQRATIGSFGVGGEPGDPLITPRG